MTPYSDLEEPEPAFHCITCSDEALPSTVLSVDEETNLAVVRIQSVTTEVDVSLLDGVAPGDVLLVHGGVALSRSVER